MLVDISEMSSILCDPADPLTPIQMEFKEGHLVAAYALRPGGREDFPVVGGCPVLIDFTASLVGRDAFERADGIVEPYSRPPSRLRPLKQHLFGQEGISRRNLHRLIDTLVAKKKLEGSIRPLVLVLGGQTVGAGCQQLYSSDKIDLVASDLWPSAATNLVADAHQIPFMDASLDCVIIQAVLEHVLDPTRVVDEIHRVLRPDGLVYAETPFLQHVHERGYDFTRWTERGHRWLFKAFDEIASGPIGGVGLTFQYALRHVFAGLLRSGRLGAWLAAPFFWLRFLDALIPPSYNLDSANGVYFLGQKSAALLSATELMAGYRGAQ